MPAAGGGGDGDTEGSEAQEAGDKKNKSLEGIELHIVADVMQQIGLTIAGSILWCVVDAFPLFACSVGCFRLRSYSDRD